MAQNSLAEGADMAKSDKRDPGEKEQNEAIKKEVAVVHPGKCPTCGRDKTNS